MQNVISTPEPGLADVEAVPNFFPESQARSLLITPIRDMGVGEAAKKAKLDRLTVSRWINGHISLSLEARLRLAEVCGYTVGVSVTLTHLGHSDAKKKPSGGA